MTARFKSHVTRREERGLFGLTMNRMIAIGGGGFLGYTLGNTIHLPLWLKVPLSIASLVLFAYWLGEPAGVPRFLVMLNGWRASIMIAGRNHPESLSGRLCAWLGWDASRTLVNGDTLFASPTHIGDDSLSGIEILDLDELGVGGIEILSDEQVMLGDIVLESDEA